MTDRISADDVRRVAELARLRLDDSEVSHFTEHLGRVLDLADELDELDLEGLPPRVQPYPLTNVLREDEPGEVLDRAEVLDQAPDSEDGRVRVPPILGEAP